MKQSIIDLARRSLSEDIYPEAVAIDYDPDDEALYPEAVRNGKRLAEYMAAQPAELAAPDSRFIGMMRFNANKNGFPGPLHANCGHLHNYALGKKHYLKPEEGIVTWDAEHGCPDFGRLLTVGVEGLLAEISEARDRHRFDRERCYFLTGAELALGGVLAWSRKCAARCEELAAESGDPDRREDLLELADICRRVPRCPAKTWREAVQCVYFCFQFLPDSIGSPDRYLRPFFEAGLTDGTLTVEQAEDDIGELLCMLSAFTPYSSCHSDKGGESHFVVGGYLPDRTDGYCRLSRLIVDSMEKLPLVRPQITVRWTPDMPREELYHVFDLERHDAGKRLAFCNDVPRIKGYMEMYDIPFERACNYIVTGCNEPAFPGAIDFTGTHTNIVPAVCDTFSRRRRDILAAPDFDGFYAVFEEELYALLRRILAKINTYNSCISQDIEILSSCFMDGCLKNGQSSLQGGCGHATFTLNVQGYVNVIDSLAVVEKFVYKDKIFTLQKLCDMLSSDWRGYERERETVLKRAEFFGNDTDPTNAVVRRLNASLRRFALANRGIFATRIVCGSFNGYWEHNVWFGQRTPATPDGRLSGDPLTLGVSQTAGKDREGMVPLMNSVAAAFCDGTMAGSVVFNLNVDETIVRDDGQFAKLVGAIETYFRSGGEQIQLDYVSREELLAAKAEPDKYKSLRVRVSGYSGYFVRLDEELQDDIIARTSHAR